jgi:hypothetical protein
MNVKSMKRPSPALIVATVALFIALGGTAGAVVNAAVPLAKRALTADNAKKLGGQSAQQLAQQASQQAAQVPGPASSAAGIVSIKSQSIGQIGPNQGRPVPIACDSGAKVLGGGFSSDGPVFNFDSYPSADGIWMLYLVNPDDAAGHNVTVYATCVK